MNSLTISITVISTLIIIAITKIAFQLKDLKNNK